MKIELEAMLDSADIDAGIFVVNELLEIFIMMKGLLNNLEKKIHLFPVHSIVGSSTRSFTTKFLNAWRDPLERTLKTLENSDYKKLIAQKSPSNDATSYLCKNKKQEALCIENGISLVTALLDRLHESVEYVSSTLKITNSDDDIARKSLGIFGIWLCIQMKPFPKVVYPKILEEFPHSMRGLNDLRPRGW